MLGACEQLGIYTLLWLPRSGDSFIHARLFVVQFDFIWHGRNNSCVTATCNYAQAADALDLLFVAKC